MKFKDSPTMVSLRRSTEANGIGARSDLAQSPREGIQVGMNAMSNATFRPEVVTSLLNRIQDSSNSRSKYQL